MIASTHIAEIDGEEVEVIHYTDNTAQMDYGDYMTLRFNTIPVLVEDHSELTNIYDELLEALNSKIEDF